MFCFFGSRGSLHRGPPFCRDRNPKSPAGTEPSLRAASATAKHRFPTKKIGLLPTAAARRWREWSVLMCLAIPGQVVEVVDERNRLAKVRRRRRAPRTSTSACSIPTATSVRPGDWVLIHVGFALSKVDEDGGARDAATAGADGRRVRDGAVRAQGERDRMNLSELPPPAHRTRRASPAPTRASSMRVMAVGAAGLAVCARRGRAVRRRSRSHCSTPFCRATCCSCTPAWRWRVCSARRAR